MLLNSLKHQVYQDKNFKYKIVATIGNTGEKMAELSVLIKPYNKAYMMHIYTIAK